MDRSGSLLVEIQEGRQQLLQLLWGHVWNVLGKIDEDGSSHSGLESRRSGILIGRWGGRLRHRVRATHAHLDAVSPFLLGPPSTIDVDSNGFFVEFQSGDLHVVPGIHCGTVGRNGPVQIFLIHWLVWVKKKTLFSSGRRVFVL